MYVWPETGVILLIGRQDLYIFILPTDWLTIHLLILLIDALDYSRRYILIFDAPKQKTRSPVNWQWKSDEETFISFDCYSILVSSTRGDPTSLLVVRGTSSARLFFSTELPSDTLRWIFDFVFWIYMKHRVPECDRRVLTSVNYLRDWSQSLF